MAIQVTYRLTRMLSMRIAKDGEVHVSVPWGVPKRVVERFIEDHRQWIEEARQKTLERQDRRAQFFAQLPLQNKAQKDEANRRLLALVEPMVREHAAEMGVQPVSVTCKPLKSKWGHCIVRTRTICFSTYLLLLPDWCIEHVVVHELCHLLQPGHGPRFHALMDRFFPRWREANKETNRISRNNAQPR